MNIAICDDVPAQLDLLEDAIHKCSMLSCKNPPIDRFTDGYALLCATHSGKSYSFIFLDIQMPEISGLELYNKLANKDTSIVFVSTHIEYLPETHALHAPGFLPKPYSQDTFNRTVRSVLEQRAETEFYTYTKGGNEHKIPCKSICFFTVVDHYLYVHTIDSKSIIYGATLNDAEKQMAGFGFFRCNRTCLVNLRYCEDRRDNKVIFKSSSVKGDIRISRRRLQEFDTQCLLSKWR